MLREYHVDALDRYNVTCDFAGVIRELRDPHKRFPFQVWIFMLKPRKTAPRWIPRHACATLHASTHHRFS